MKLSISEILKRASEMPDVPSRAMWLRNNYSDTLKTVLIGFYSPYIKWLLPEGEPPYKKNEIVDQQHRLYSEARKMYLFVEGGNPNLNQLRREALFIEMLESLDPEDAKLLLAMKDGVMPYPNITKDFIVQTFPGMIPE
jgi:hypothetical protein